MTQIVSAKNLTGSFYQSFITNSWGRTALVVTAVTVILGIFAKKFVQQNQGKIFWGSNDAKATFVQKMTFVVRNALFGLADKEISNYLASIASKGNEQSAKCFQLNKEAAYFAYGPDAAQGETLRFENILQSSSADLIINLMDYDPTIFFNVTGLNVKQGDHLGFGDKSKRFTLGDKPLYHFPLYDDGKTVEKQLIGNLIFLAKKAAMATQEGSNVFVFCKDGLQRTAAFICAAEFIRRQKQDQFKGFSDAQLRLAMVSIMEEVAQTAKGRIPNQAQIDMLLDPKFLQQLMKA